MALDNKLRVSELVQSGSRAIISEDPLTKTHTFLDGGTTFVSKSEGEPYDHIEGERDGELTNYIEKPKYDEEQLKKAVDTEIDELILPPLPPDPEVVPKEVYDDLLEKYNQAIADLGKANNRIRELEAQVASLQGQVQALQTQLDAARVAQAIAENQAQQTNIKYADLLSKFSTAIIKSTKEGIQRVSLNAQVEGLTAQKDTLREQIVQLRQIVASLQGQVAAQLDILELTQQQAEEAIQVQQQTNLRDMLSQYRPNTWEVSGNIGYLVNRSHYPEVHTRTTDGGSSWQFYFDDRRTNGKGVMAGRQISFYNIATEPVTLQGTKTTVNGSGDVTNLPTSMTIPAGTPDAGGKIQPGKKTFILKRSTNAGKGTSDGKIIYRDPNSNDRLQLNTHYWQARTGRSVGDYHPYSSETDVVWNSGDLVQPGP